MKLLKIQAGAAGMYATCGLLVNLFFQTKFLRDECYHSMGADRPNALQVRGDVVFVTDWEYYLFKAALYPSVLIILALIFGTIILRSKGRK